MAYELILLAAQAAGIGANLYGERQNRRISNSGVDIEQGQLRLRMQEEQLAGLEQSNLSLENLRETMASQRAIEGARGQLPGVGSSLAVANKSVAAQGADERARKLSQSFRESQAEGLSRLLNVKKATAKSASGAKLLDYGLNSLSLNTSIGEFIDKMKKSQTTGAKPGSSKSNWRSPSFIKPKMGQYNG